MGGAEEQGDKGREALTGLVFLDRGVRRQEIKLTFCFDWLPPWGPL